MNSLVMDGKNAKKRIAIIGHLYSSLTLSCRARSHLIILITYLFASSTFAAEQSNYGNIIKLIKDQLTQIKSTCYKDLIFETDPRPRRPTSDRPSVRVQYVKNGPSQRPGYLFEKAPEDNWLSYYTQYVDNVDGNPMTIFKLSHAAFAREVGLIQLGPNQLFVEAPELLGKALREHNAHWAPDLAFSLVFYPYEGIVPEREYIQRFVLEGALPVALTRTMIHDVSYHVPFILATPKIFEHFRDQARLGWLMINHLERNGVSDEVIKGLLYYYEHYIDISTGNFGIVYKSHKPTSQDLQSPLEILTEAQKQLSLSDEVTRLIENYLDEIKMQEWTRRSMSREEFVYQIRIRQNQISGNWPS